MSAALRSLLPLATAVAHQLDLALRARLDWTARADDTARRGSHP